MEKIISLCKSIDNINHWIAKVLTILLFPLLGITLYGIIMRYGFNMPPNWGWQVLLLLFYPIALLGGGYVLSVDGHVKLDLLYSRWSVKSRKISDSVTFLAFLLFTVCLAKVSIKIAWDSTASQESYATYAFNGPIWPGKVTLAVGVVLLAIQGLSIFIRNVLSLMTNRKTDFEKTSTEIKEQ